MKHKTLGRLRVLKWHRRMGVILSFFLLWMLGSGILINHAHDLALDKRSVQSDFWLTWYGLSPAKNLSIGSKNVTLNQEGLWLGEHNVGDCSRLLGVAHLPQEVVIVCPSHIFLLSLAGELIDHVDKSRGLVETLVKVAVVDQHVILQDQTHHLYKLDTQALALVLQPPSETHIPWQHAQLPQQQLSYERWLLDAHSGRLWGIGGKWLVDGFSLVMIVLIISGWLLAARRRPKRA